MIRTPEDLPGTPSVDVLSDLLRVVRLSGAVLVRGDLTAPWTVETPPPAQLARRLLPGARRLVILHVVAEGHCWIALDDGERVPMPPRTLAVLPYADAHVMSSGERGEPVPIVDLMPAAATHAGVPVVAHGGGGAATRLVCGVLHCDELLFNPVLKTLPRLLVARPAPGAESSLVSATIRHLVEEAATPQAGGACLRARLAELLLLEVLRGHLASLPPRAPGWLGAVNDPLVGGALQQLHARPRERWTVARLARQVGASRSRLGTRFTALVGEPPMRYLTRWRLQLAARMLREGEAGLAAIAEQVGYESEAAFNRAFKRHAGAPPGAWRARPAAS
jgi:AraC family transcriptional regulator, alkane utilization regulator